jgi:hypothetical protein
MPEPAEKQNVKIMPTPEEIIQKAAASATDKDRKIVSELTKPGQKWGSREVEITPGIAGLILLHHNGINRGLRLSTARRYRRIMERGHWKRNKDTIAFDITGKLRDGQHRLIAVAWLGMPVHIGVTVGEDVDAAEHYDYGEARTPASLLEMKGITQPKLRPAIIKEAIAYQRKRETGKSPTLDRYEIVKAVQDHGTTLDTAINLALNSREKPPDQGASFEPCLKERDAGAVAFLMLTGGWRSAEVTSFLNALQRGVGEGENHPIERCASMLLADLRSKQKAGMRAAQKISLVLEVAILNASNKRKTLRIPKPTSLAPFERPSDLPEDLVGSGISLAG